MSSRFSFSFSYPPGYPSKLLLYTTSSNCFRLFLCDGTKPIRCSAQTRMFCCYFYFCYLRKINGLFKKKKTKKGEKMEKKKMEKCIS